MADDGLWPASAFWRFSLQTYARPDVADACLALQEREGADVNLLLLACWLASRARRPDAALAARLRAAAAEQQGPIVRPLRAARRALRARSTIADEFLAQPLEALRRAVAKAEIEAERAEQLSLERLVQEIPEAGDATGEELAAINLELLTGFAVADHAELRTLIASALGPGGA